MADSFRVRIALLLLATVVGSGILGYRLLEGYSWLEAVYMTTITLTTVGFQEVRPLTAVGRVFTIALLVAGVGVVLYTSVAVTQWLIEGEFHRVFGRRRMEKRIAALRAHYIVCGFGRIGELICHELAVKPTPFVVIENDPERIRRAEEAGWAVLVGDATQEETLTAAGVQHARGLFAALATDAENVFVTLTAKELSPEVIVVARAELERSEKTLRHAGADRVISPYAMGAHRMAQAALRPAVVDIVELVTHHQNLELQLEEVAVPAGSPWEGATLGEAQLCEPGGVIIVAIKRAAGRLIVNPGPGERLEVGDRVIVLAEASRLKEFERRASGRGQ